MQGALAVAETTQLAVSADVQRETVALHSCELFYSLTGACVEALCTDIVVTHPSQDQIVLLGHEAHAIDDRVDYVAIGRLGPDELANWCLEVASQIPQLHALTKCTSTRHHHIIIVTDVDTIS